MKYPLKATQIGMTMWQIMVVLLIIGFMATVAVKLGPSYADNHVVTSALDDVQKSYAGTNMDEVKDSDIIRKLDGYFQVNMVSNDAQKASKVTRVQRKVILSVNYEIRQNFMGNVDVVLVFNNEVDLAKQ